MTILILQQLAQNFDLIVSFTLDFLKIFSYDPANVGENNFPSEKIISIARPMLREILLKLPLFLLFAIFSCAGCCLDQERWRTPNILHPGHIDDQRHNMHISDPLPAAGVGMKNSGIRPRDADLPRDPFYVKSGIYEDAKPDLIQP